MPGGEAAHWPLCAVCSELMGEPTVVEEYGVPPDGVVWRDGEVVQFTVEAACSHGRGFKAGTVRRQKAKIDVPAWWGVAHKDDAVRSLIFFAPGAGAPTHNVVTSIANG
jgi:hypothetical protein